MEPDYPAAHSMDTTWFAVDREGYVGLFNTGEAGAMPEDALAGEEVGAGLEAALPARAGWLMDPAPGRHRSRGPDGQHLQAGMLSMDYPIKMFLTSTESIRKELDAGRARQMPAVEGAAILWKRLPPEIYKRLHQEGVCRYCTFHYEDLQDATAASRFFLFEHMEDNWIAGAYARESQPAQPVRLDELPPEFQAKIGGHRFSEFTFRETPYIQPAEHGPCVSWGPSWLSSDGRNIHAFPGREEEYAEEYEELQGSLEPESGYTIDPPTVERKASPPPSQPDRTNPWWKRFFGG